MLFLFVGQKVTFASFSVFNKELILANSVKTASIVLSLCLKEFISSVEKDKFISPKLSWYYII